MTIAAVEPLLLSKADVEAVAPSILEMVSIVEETYRLDAKGDVDVPHKIGVHPGSQSNFLHAMPAWVPALRALGTKIITYYPGNFSKGVHDSSGIIVMYDPDTGQPVAIIEGLWITFVRTATCAGVAAKYLVGKSPRKLGLVGCGGLGYWSLKVLGAIFPTLSEVYVSSRTEQSRTQFCRQMVGEGNWTLTPVADVRNAVSNMDIVVSSTPQSPDPRLHADWISPGTVLIPLDYPFSWDDATYRLIDRLVTDSDTYLIQIEETWKERGVRPKFRLPEKMFSLSKAVAGSEPRLEPDDRLLAIITGLASTDVTLAWEIYNRAVSAGVGQRFRMS